MILQGKNSIFLLMQVIHCLVSLNSFQVEIFLFYRTRILCFPGSNFKEILFVLIFKKSYFTFYNTIYIVSKCIKHGFF